MLVVTKIRHMWLSNKKINFIFRIKVFRFTKTLGVPCAEIYPLNLMQLVLPKGKVRATFPVVFSIPVTGHSYRSKK